ncbi:MAG: hypothetical protein ACRBN8_12950 [Nannocystales bacterium]
MADWTGTPTWFPSLRTASLVVALAVTGCFNPDDGGELDPEATEGSSSSSSTSTTSSTSDGGDSSSTGGDTNDEVCSDYCALIGDHCQDDNAQYNGDAICEATCANMPVGNAGDELGNSASCRTFHAVLAAEEPDTHCAHAGPAGDGTCGADCESFCSVALTLCSGDLAVYSGTEDCITACEAFATEPPYSANVPDADTFSCRLRHLTLASLQPEVHCSHIAPVSPVCFD